MHPVAGLAQVPLFPAPSHPTLERHLGGLVCVSRTNPHLVLGENSSTVRELPMAPWAAQGSVSVTMLSRVCSVTMVALVACTSSDTGGCAACYQCGVALGHLVRVSRCTR